MSRVQAIEKEIKKLKELKEASKDYLEAIAGKGNTDKVVKAI
jgi:archaellum component FlaC